MAIGQHMCCTMRTCACGVHRLIRGARVKALLSALGDVVSFGQARVVPMLDLFPAMAVPQVQVTLQVPLQSIGGRAVVSAVEQGDGQGPAPGSKDGP